MAKVHSRQIPYLTPRPYDDDDDDDGSGWYVEAQWIGRATEQLDRARIGRLLCAPGAGIKSMAHILSLPPPADPAYQPHPACKQRESRRNWRGRGGRKRQVAPKVNCQSRVQAISSRAHKI